MPDTFDPDAWPDGGNGASNGRPASKSGTSQTDEPDIFGPPTGPSTNKDPDDKAGGSPFDEPDTGFDDAPDDFANFDDMGDFGDYDPEPAPRRNAGSGTSAQSKDDFYDEDDDDPYDTGYDDYDDYDDDFSREPGGGDDNKRKLIGIGAVVFLIGAIAFLGVVVFSNDDGPTATAPQASSDVPQQAPAAGGFGNGAGSPASTNGPPPAEVKQAIDTALEHWGVFAINGDINEVRPYFSPTGEQYNQFQIESPERKANPFPGPPFTVKMADPQGSESNGEWVVRGLVEWSQPGKESQQFPWEIRLTRQSEREPWQVLTIRQY